MTTIRERDAAKGRSEAGVTMTQSESDRRVLLAALDRLVEAVSEARLELIQDVDPDAIIVRLGAAIEKARKVDQA